jgi:hypothetical protein
MAKRRRIKRIIRIRGVGFFCDKRDFSVKLVQKILSAFASDGKADSYVYTD